ncbi:neuroguidin-like [Halichondria panicea]|uniref:neuroguidin-like n=1 Tax=Halichondria panicea TaxID=6063 RepID=UPI00312B36D4
METLGVKMLAQDLPKGHQLLSEITDRVKAVREHVAKIRAHALTGGHKPEAGISLLELKFQLLLSYLVNIVQVVMMKLNGQSINCTPPLHRIVEIRTVLEKIRPLDQKLKYQMEKLVRTATTGMASASDPLRFKPNPSNLVSKVDESESSDEERPTSNPKLYMPPKVVSTPYDENPGRREKKNRNQTALIEELKEEVLDMPSEVKTSMVVGGLQKRRELAREKDLERFEENNMMRLSRKRKSHDTGRSNRQELDDLAEFSELKSITQDFGEYPPKKKSKSKRTSKKKKRSFR